MTGVQRVSLNEIQKLKDQYEYSLLCSNEGPLTEQLTTIGIEYSTIPTLVREISPINDLKALISLIRHIKEGKFDVVHTHSSKTGLLGRIAAKITGVKKIVHSVHGFAFPAAKSKIQYIVYFLMEYLAKYFTDHLIVLNKTDYHYAVSKLGYSKNKVSIIPNGVDIDYFEPSLKDNKEITFLMVGRLWQQKDPLTLIKAAAKLKFPQKIIIIIAGDGDLFDACSSYIKNNNLSKVVALHGWVSDVKGLLDKADVFILPSKWEGMPLAILEAMASGLPCIVTDIPGNNDLVVSGENGLLFPIGDYKLLSEHIDRLANDDILRAEMSEASRHFAVQRYSLDERNKKIIELYGQ